MQTVSSEIPTIIKKCPKNDDGSLHLDSLKTLSDLSEVGYNSKDIFRLMYDIKANPLIKDFIVDAGAIFEDKQNVFKLIPYSKDKMGKPDENSLDTLNVLVANITRNNPTAPDEKMFADISSVMEEIKNPYTGQVGDDAAGICSILSKNNFSFNSIKNVLYGCQEIKGVYNARLSEIVWKLSLENATVVELTNVLAGCRKHDRTMIADKVETILQMFENGAKKDDVIAFVNQE